MKPLPLLITEKSRYPAGVLMFTLAYVIYYSANHFVFFQPTLLPLTELDQAIPFVPWTVMIYVSEFVFFGAAYIACRDLMELNKFFYSYLSTLVFSCTVFFFWPTVYPRELFPIPPDTEPFIQTVWHWLRTQDSESCCFPSLHVSMAFLSSFIYLKQGKAKFAFFFTWGLLIALSTLPTKQHYFSDVVAGLAVAFGSYWLFHRKLEYRVLWHT